MVSAVIGISASYHDAAACLFLDGELAGAATEERFSRRKHDPDLPVRTIRWLLEENGLSFGEVEAIAWYEQPGLRAERIRRFGDPSTSVPEDPAHTLESRCGWTGPVICVPHHLSHASSAYHFSGQPNAAVLVADGVGEWATTSYWHGTEGELVQVGEVRYPHSLGLFYSTMTQYLGFTVNSGEYKVMGLAPYGRPTFADEMEQLIPLAGGPGLELDLPCFSFESRRSMFTSAMVDRLGLPPRDPTAPLQQVHCDLAASVQRQLERHLLEKTRWLLDRTGATSLCLAGGVALNCVANTRIRSTFGVESVFVQPAANDAGACLGAARIAIGAIAGAHPAREVPTAPKISTMALGPRANSDEIEGLLRSLELPRRRLGPGALVDLVAGRLAEGAVVGWLHGPMEFGPRALGHRSILADPRRPDMRDRVNAQVKHRESFRPFAPAVPLERASEFFELDEPDPFMIFTCQVRPEVDLPAVTHVDGSARVQTVGEETNPMFHRLLTGFGDITGVPVLLNTSFNVADEPIVCTPADALLCAVRAGLDVLVLEDFVLEARDIDQGRRTAVEALYVPEAPVVSHAVYAHF